MLGLIWPIYIHFASSKNTVEPKQNNSNNINISGNVYNSNVSQTINELPEPEINIKIHKESKKETDGFFHTVFWISIYYMQGTTSPELQASSILECQNIDGKNTARSISPNGVIIFLECKSKSPILTTEGLFKTVKK